MVKLFFYNERIFFESVDDDYSKVFPSNNNGMRVLHSEEIKKDQQIAQLKKENETLSKRNSFFNFFFKLTHTGNFSPCSMVFFSSPPNSGGSLIFTAPPGITFKSSQQTHFKT